MKMTAMKAAVELAAVGALAADSPVRVGGADISLSAKSINPPSKDALSEGKCVPGLGKRIRKRWSCRPARGASPPGSSSPVGFD